MDYEIPPITFATYYNKPVTKIRHVVDLILQYVEMGIIHVAFGSIYVNFMPLSGGPHD